MLYREPNTVGGYLSPAFGMGTIHSQIGLIFYVVITLTHHKNSGYTELKVLGVYFPPAAGGGKIYNAQLSFCLPHF